MKKKKLLSVLVAAAMSCSLFSAVPIVSQAEEDTEYPEYTCGDYIYNIFEEGTCDIRGYIGSDKDIDIPSELDGNTVVAIEGAFFENKDITSVTIPDSVWYIGWASFIRCTGLCNVDLGNGVSVLENLCFSDCDSLTSISLPASMTSSDAETSYPFQGCDSLKTVTIESGGVKIPATLFWGCSALENVKIPEGITKIEEFAFCGCSALKRIILPDSINVIEDRAFAECSSLKDIYDYNEKTEYTVNQFNQSVFYNSPSVIIHGYPGSNAEKYAKEQGIAFVPLTEEELDERAKEIVEDGKQMMYRLYNPNSGEHFYTSDSKEKDNLVTVGWAYEGTAWIAPASSNTPVYRLYNPNSSEHHYTMKSSEKDFLVGLGWNDEGIGWYSDDSQGTPLYRLYNPNATGDQEAGGHHYTKDTAERDRLIGLGWNDEGIGWYGV